MSFKSQIAKFNQEAKKDILLTFRGSALGMFRRIVLRTPVGNPEVWETKYPPKGYVGGRLRGNWQAEINKPADGELETKDKDGGKTVNAAANTVNMARLGDSLFFVNNLPYAQAIEHGHSRKQRPTGMVKVVVNQYLRIVRQEARKNK